MQQPSLQRPGKTLSRACVQVTAGAWMVILEQLWDLTALKTNWSGSRTGLKIGKWLSQQITYVSSEFIWCPLSICASLLFPNDSSNSWKVYNEWVSVWWVHRWDIQSHSSAIQKKKYAWFWSENDTSGQDPKSHVHSSRILMLLVSWRSGIKQVRHGKLLDVTLAGLPPMPDVTLKTVLLIQK
jgi:hypothetical protein